MSAQPSPVRAESPGRWVILALFSLVGFLITAATFSSLGVVLPDMVASLRMNWTQAGLGFTLLGAAVGGSSFLPMLLIRRVGVRTTLLTGCGALAVGFVALALTQGIAAYFAGALLCGVGYQLLSFIPATHVLAAIFARRGLAFGVCFTFASLGSVAGPWMVSTFMAASHHDWRGYWSWQAGIAVLLAIACAALTGGPGWLRRLTVGAGHDAEAPMSNTAGWSVRDATRSWQFAILLAAYFGSLLVGVTVAGLSVAHLIQRGIPAGVAGAMLSLEAVVQTGGRALVSAGGERVRPRIVLIVGLAGMAIGVAALSIASDMPMMLVYAVGSGLGFGLTGLAVTMLLIDYFGREHNLELYTLTASVGAFSALGPTLGGILRDATGSFASTFQIYAAVSLVLLLATLRMKAPARHA